MQALAKRSQQCVMLVSSPEHSDGYCIQEYTGMKLFVSVLADVLRTDTTGRKCVDSASWVMEHNFDCR